MNEVVGPDETVVGHRYQVVVRDGQVAFEDLGPTPEDDEE